METWKRFFKNQSIDVHILIDISLNCSRLGAGFPFPEALAQCTTFLYGLTELF